MKEHLATTGLSLNEPLLWEKAKKGRSGFSMPARDVDAFPMDSSSLGDISELPDLSELDVVRHYTRLSQWNYGVDSGMYPLGSCTMKYNPKVNERQASLHGFASSHPMLSFELSQGILNMMFHLEGYLSEITGLPAVTLQPAAGAQGELTGMMIAKAFHAHSGSERKRILIPDTAHGTNPASSAICGFTPIPVESNEQGILSAERVKVAMDEDTLGIMITNPNTLGLFEEHIREISDIVHSKGGLVYVDGANMNAVMGIINMGDIGVDIMHLNLHKTFSTPHGGGGPGSGPVCVTKRLEPFLPVPRIVEKDGSYVLSEDFPDSIGKLHAFYGNVGVLIKAYSYIRSMGSGLKKASQLAVLNANYLKEKLKDIFYLPYDRTCMHECVFSDKLQEKYRVTTLDIAKRLMDYGFHPPTVYFPLVVHGAIMVEPTESESKETLDLFIGACREIANEASQNPKLLFEAPILPRSRRMDETGAARNPYLAR